MKALIIDDERLARLELGRLLREFPSVTVIGEAVDADDARRKINELMPDLIFLDVQMPGKSGFELLEELDETPIVVFTTAYDEYALKAFDVNALDYLLKPIDPKRLSTTIAKLEGLPSEEIPKSETLEQGSRIFVKDGERCWFVKLMDVRLFESEGNYTRLHFDTHRPLVPRSLNYLESRLDPLQFFRASRKHIINLRWIESVCSWPTGGLQVTLKDGTNVEMSRRQSQKFRDMTRL